MKQLPTQIKSFKMQLENQLKEFLFLRPYFTGTTLHNINFPISILIQYNSIEQHITNKMRLQDVMTIPNDNKLYTCIQ